MEDRQITEHFRLSEFACKDGTWYPVEWIDSRLTPLCYMDEIIRDACGGHAVTILCGYRTLAYNDHLREKGLTGESGKTGVAEHSQHIEGMANDIVVFGIPTMTLYKIVLDLYYGSKLPMLGGIGLYQGHGFVHVDVHKSQDGHLRKWVG